MNTATFRSEFCIQVGPRTLATFAIRDSYDEVDYNLISSTRKGTSLVSQALKLSVLP